MLKFHCSLQNNMFPERGIVFDFFFQKVGSTWAAWEDMIERTTTIPQGAKVPSGRESQTLCTTKILITNLPVYFYALAASNIMIFACGADVISTIE